MFVNAGTVPIVLRPGLRIAQLQLWRADRPSAGPYSANGKAISNTDRIGVLVNMDTSEMTLYRNEQPINEGNLVRGFPKDNVRIVAQCTKGNITLAFPPKP